jgi:hypothetical protein
MDEKNLNNIVRTGSMGDVGTRISFLLELYELWETGLDILEKYDRRAPFYAERKAELEAALKLLFFHMSKDYIEPNPNL